MEGEDAVDDRSALSGWARATLGEGAPTRELVDRVQSDAPGYSWPQLLALLTEVQRRSDSLEPGSDTDWPDSLERSLQRHLASRRDASDWEVERQQLSAEPLRSRILDELALAPSRPTELATRLGASKEAVSRALAKLRSEELVVDEHDSHDGRRKIYALTGNGTVARQRHRRVGLSSPDGWRPFQGDVPVDFLTAELDRAVRIRRHANSLAEALVGIQYVGQQADEYGLQPLGLRAMCERLATLRQLARQEEWESGIRELGTLVTGEQTLSAGAATPAVGYLHYERGRGFPMRDCSTIASRVGSLVAAAYTFGMLSRDRSPHEDRWQSRRAWAIFGIADIYRQETEVGLALGLANLAARLFAEVDDDYGVANSVFLVGFCLRLRGRFVHAGQVLKHAVELAEGGGFERLRANALVQMGEASRLVGEPDDAAALLIEGRDLATRLNAGVTEAFAMSSLGAVAYEAGSWAKADTCFRSAQAQFEVCHHGAGLALNLRRRGVLKRVLSTEGGSASRKPAEKLVRSALHEYERLESPAGIVGCWVETGRLQLDAGLSPDTARMEILAAARKPNWRRLLEHDPWLPGNLAQFAAYADDDEILKLSSELTIASESRVERHDWEFVKSLTDADSSDIQMEVRDFEMAGEPRRLSDLADEPLSSIVLAS
jgi:DNA-binding MarR family transcriptional regulator/tetratricopeptide (TPR) repeat protein